MTENVRIHMSLLLVLCGIFGSIPLKENLLQTFKILDINENLICKTRGSQESCVQAYDLLW